MFKRIALLLVVGLLAVWITRDQVAKYRLRVWQQQRAEEEADKNKRAVAEEKRQLDLQRCLNLTDRAYEQALAKNCRERSLGPGCFTPPWITGDFERARLEQRGVCQGHYGDAPDAIAALRR